MQKKLLIFLLFVVILPAELTKSQDFVGNMQQGKIYYNKQDYVNAYDRFSEALTQAKTETEKKDADTWKFSSLKSMGKQHKEMESTLNNSLAELKKAKFLLETLYFYDNRIALACKEMKYGFIDKNGNTIIKFIYDEAGPFDSFSGFAKVSRGNVQYLIDTLGNEYPLATNCVAINGGTVALDLRNQQLNSIPSNVFSCGNLKVLLLSNNQLTSIPADISRLRNLLFLDLSNNKIQNLPEEIGQLNYLKFLSLSGNQLSKLPENFALLQNLEDLKLNNNNLFALPKSFGNLSNLNYLNLDDNKLKSLQPEICKLYSIKTITVQRNGVETIADEIGNLDKVETLILNENSIMDLPKTMERMKNLKKLYLLRNRVGNIPLELKKLSGLKEFDIRGNRIPEDKKGMIRSWFPGCNILI